MNNVFSCCVLAPWERGSGGGVVMYVIEKQSPAARRGNELCGVMFHQTTSLCVNSFVLL